MPSVTSFARRIVAQSIIITVLISSLSPVLTTSFAETQIDSYPTEKTNDEPQIVTVEGEILIKYKDEAVNLRTAVGIEESRDLMQEQDITKKEDIDTANISVVIVSPDDMTVEQKIIELEKDPRVESAQPNYQYYPTDLGTNDTYAANLWALYQLSDVDIDAPEAWTLGEGSGTIVAVIDTGVAYNHPDLINSMWDGSLCKSEEGAALGGCQHGYDFENDDKIPLPTSSSHGTHVAGTIAAQKNNALGVAGVAPQTKIMAIRSSLTTDNIIMGMNFAKNNGAKIINASWGSEDPWFVNDIRLIEAIQNFPGIFITAAGNGGDDEIGDDNESIPFYPSSYNLSNIISVAATDQNDALASFSNYGSISVDVGAPGTNIYSTIMNDSYGYMSGTSMATPHVVGVAALLWGMKPSLTVAEVKAAILNTGDSIGALAGKTTTGRRINAYNALLSISSTKAITAFNLTDPVTTGIIDENTHTIQLTVGDIPITALTPIITHTGVSITPASGVVQNFSSPIDYIVTAGDGSTQKYTVTVSPVRLAEAITAEIGADHALPVYSKNAADYTEESWAAYTAAINAAILVENNIESTLQEMSNSVSSIITAKAQLIFAGKADLESAKSTVAGHIQADYTDASWTVFSSARTAALALPETTNALIVDKTVAINSAQSTLVFAGKADLDTAVSDANARVQNTYTDASWTVFDGARTTALALPETTNALVVAKREALNAAILSLITRAADADLTTAKNTTISLVQNEYTVDSWTALSTALALSETTNSLVLDKTLAINTAVEGLVYAVTLTTMTPQALITVATSVTIDSGTINPSIGSGIVGGTGILPQITITANNANSAVISIPASTTVTATNALWDGVISTPTTTSITLPVIASETKTLSTAIQIGYAGEKLSFDKGVRILLPGQAGKRAGYSRTGTDFTEITTPCTADNQSTGDALPVDGECIITVGSDLIIWTKHFTTFATFSAVAVVSVPNNAGGGGGGGGGASSVVIKKPTMELQKLNSAPSDTTRQAALDSFLAKSLTENKRTGFATRLETVLLSLTVQGTPILRDYTCQNHHTDTFGNLVPSYTCQVAEKAQAAKIISDTNKQFNPMKSVSRIEAYTIMMKSICVMPETTNTNWQTEVIKKARELGFTVRTIETFEPDRPLTIPEMYIIVQRLSDYSKTHDSCVK